MQKNTKKCFLQVFLRSTIVFYVNGSLYPRVFCISADPVLSQHCQIQEKTGDPAWRCPNFRRAARARYQRKRVTQSSVAKMFSALRALGLPKQNFLCAARTRYQRKRVTQSSVATFFSALRARKGCKSKTFSRQIPEKTGDPV